MTFRIERLADHVDLYCGDCFEVLSTLGQIDAAVVTDPPYGMDYDTDSTRFSGGRSDLIRRTRGQGRDDRFIEGDSEPFDPSPWLSFDELVLWGANHYANRLPTGSTLVWLKRYIAQYGSFLSDAEIGWQKGGYGVYAFHAPDSPGRRAIDLGARNPMGAPTTHPSQKPIALMSWCIERIKNSLILDPYMGSGTTGVAAVHLDRKFIGIEKMPGYFDIALRRIGDALKQPRLFARPLPPIDQAGLDLSIHQPPVTK